MTRKKRAWNMSNPLYRYLHKKKRSSSKRSVVKMARGKSKGRSSGGLGLGKLFSLKNIALVAAVAYMAPKVAPNIDPKLLTAAAGFVGAGPIGGIAGYLAQPMISQAVGQATGGITASAQNVLG